MKMKRRLLNKIKKLLTKEIVTPVYVPMMSGNLLKDKTVLIAMRPGKRKQLPKDSILSQFEYLKSQIRAKVEHPFHWLKCIFGLKKLRYRGLYKNAQMLYAMFGLINLCKNKGLLMSPGA